MKRSLRILSGLLGTLLALALLVAGLAVLFEPVPLFKLWLPAAALLAAGMLVAMCLVIDPLVPRANRSLALTLKLATTLAMVACGGLAAYLAVAGGPPAI